MKLRTAEAIVDRLLHASDRVQFDDPSHTYRLRSSGQLLTGTTSVLRAFFPDAFKHVDPAVLERKRQIGNAAHQATHYYDRGILDNTSVADEVRGYLAAWLKFRAERQPRIIATELRLAHPVRPLAGTIDKLVWLPGAPLDVVCVLDLKTGDPAAARTHLQTASYAEIVRALLNPLDAQLREEIVHVSPLITRLGVHLKADGSYAVTPYTNRGDWRRFATLFDALTILREEAPHVAAVA